MEKGTEMATRQRSRKRAVERGGVVEGGGEGAINTCVLRATTCQKNLLKSLQLGTPLKGCETC